MKEVDKNIALTTKDLTIGYSNKKSIKSIASNINIVVKKGCLVAVLGKNGIGKSTLLRTISGVQSPLSGKIILQDQEIEEYSNKEISKILSMVLTERIPESQLTVFELVALGRQPYSNWFDSLLEEDIQKINWALELTEISHLKSRYFYELSDGQLQRVLIARALAQDTAIIILDEPTVHLDLHHTIKIFKLLKELVIKTNKTIILSSHEINLSIQLADQIILLKDNEVVSNQTKVLIEEDAFNNMFPKEMVIFNKELKQFIIKPN